MDAFVSVLQFIGDEIADTELLIERRVDVADPDRLRRTPHDLLAEYLAETGLSSPNQIVPDDFVRWIFPALVAHRRPKYEALATKHGYTVDARRAEQVESERDFLELVASAL